MKRKYLLVALLLVLFSLGCIGEAPKTPVTPITQPTPTPTPAAPPSTIYPPPSYNLTVYFINVSQADSILIVTPGNKTILIDGGDRGTGDAVASFIRSRGYERLDVVVASHMHSDHIGGLSNALNNNFSVGHIYDSGVVSLSTQYINYTTTRSRYNYTPLASDLNLNVDSFLDTLRLIVTYDSRGSYYNDENDNSVILKIVYRNSSFLFTGDCEGPCEDELRKTEGIDVDVLKVGHHGSETSSSTLFLSEVTPRISVISVNKDDRRYHHPRKSTIDRLYVNFSSDVRRTDLEGTVAITTSGDGTYGIVPSAAGVPIDERVKGWLGNGTSYVYG